MATGTDAVCRFRMEMYNTVGTLSLNQVQWGKEEWKILARQATPEVLHDAAEMAVTASKLFSHVGMLIPRSEKTSARVAERADRGFQAVGDWVGFRINCEISETQAKVSAIQTATVQQEGGYFWQKQIDSRFTDPRHTHYQDITQFVYAYTPDIGYPVEIQINHPFASYTFASDTRLRQNPACGDVNLWSDNFYSEVKSYILDKENGFEVNEERKKALLEKAERLHPNGVPAELQKILKTL